MRVGWRVVDEARLIRLEAAVKKDEPTYNKFVQAFGLTAFAESRKYGPNGETFIRYEWVRPDE
jgi:hypothetical protein